MFNFTHSYRYFRIVKSVSRSTASTLVMYKKRSVLAHYL